jgi:hypothetical protein
MGPGLNEWWAKRNNIPVEAVCSASQLIEFYRVRHVMYFDSRPHTPEVAKLFAKMDELVLSLGDVLAFRSRPGLEALGPCPNLVGGIVDDLSSNIPGGKYTPDSVATIYRRLKACGSHLKLYAVIYTRNFDLDFAAYLPHMDVVSLWVWQSRDLPELDRHVERCRELFPGKPIVLGLYLYEYPARRAMPIDLVQFEFRRARDYVRQGLIQGYQVLGSYLVEELATPQALWVRDFVAGK